LLGLALAGQPVSPYLAFPPRPVSGITPSFLWAAFVPAVAVVALVCLPFLTRLLDSLASLPRAKAARPFPAWGWAGVGLGLASWVLAWTRFGWFSPWQLHTFAPLWLSYILVVNAVTWRRTGHCMLRDRPRFLLLLFPASAAFWWFFEYLNRFVSNWHYAGVRGMSAGEYFILATLPFATVLPALLGTREWLASFPVFDRAFSRFGPRWLLTRRNERVVGLALAALATAGLAAIGLVPHVLFPLLWLAPLFIVVGLQAVVGHDNLLREVARGDWRRIVTAAAAGLVCGFFWELWNAGSLAHWVYTIPHVHRFELFEMPALGFAGYLPFGLECLVLGDWLAARRVALMPRVGPRAHGQETAYDGY
jgi:hypothetical protein